MCWGKGSGKVRLSEMCWSIGEMERMIVSLFYIEKILSGKRGSPEDKIKKAGICCFEDSDFFLLKKLKKQIKAVYFLRRHRARTILPL